MKKTRDKQRLLSVIIALALLISMLPMFTLTALAVEDGTSIPPHTYVQNPDAPYDAYLWGLYHDQVGVSSNLDSAAPRTTKHSIYIPKGLQPWRRTVMVLTPNNTTARAFSHSTIGEAWIAIADKYSVAIAFYEPQDGLTWNLTEAVSARDEYISMAQVYAAMRDKSTVANALFGTDKSHISLVGYGEGGAMALQLAIASPTMFCNVATINATAASQEIIAAKGNEVGQPNMGDIVLNATQLATVGLKNNGMPQPLWIISADAGVNTFADSYWAGINNAISVANNEYTTARYSNGATPAEVWVTRGSKADEITPDILFNAFSAKTGRFMGLPGATIRESVYYFASDGADPRYKIVERRDEDPQNRLRRWIVYTPSSYNAAEKTPLVLVSHGANATPMAIAEESRWAEVAESYGFIVIFGQSFPNRNTAGFYTPGWVAGTGDVEFLQNLIGWAKANYNIDATRVYATGHSNGGSMTYSLALAKPELFAAVAPVGNVAGPSAAQIEVAHAKLPIWIIGGDLEPLAANLTQTSTQITSWKSYNNISVTPSVSADDLFTTTKYIDGGIPMLSFSIVKNSPHVYMEEEALLLWTEFFSKISREADGTVIYTKDPIVSVSTPTLVATFAADLAISVEDAFGKDLTAYLMNGDKEICPTALINNKGIMHINAGVLEAGTYDLIVKGEAVFGSYQITVVPYNMDIWSANAFIFDGKLQVKFNDDVALKSGINCAAIGGTAYNAAVLADKRTVEIDVPAPVSSAAVSIKGVKYPGLFPSYMFTFTVQIP